MNENPKKPSSNHNNLNKRSNSHINPNKHTINPANLVLITDNLTHQISVLISSLNDMIALRHLVTIIITLVNLLVLIIPITLITLIILITLLTLINDLMILIALTCDYAQFMLSQTVV